MQVSDVFRHKYAMIVTLALLLHAGVFYGFSRSEKVPIIQPLSSFPKEFNGWKLFQEGVVDQETRSVLQADDILSRHYISADGALASVFIAYFETQRTGRAPHSPKNCLPGNGWAPTKAEIISIDVPGEAPIDANRYIVSRSDDRSVVLYWYQSRNRTVASEYWAKVFTVADSIRYNRSDTALVRIVVSARGGGEEAATALATRFARDMFKFLRAYLPA
jgi:EpsI family protein